MPEQVAWGAGREAAFREWIHQELLDAQTARLGLDKQHRDWLSQYRVSATPATKRFPYEGASNWTLPLTAIDVDVLYARFMQTIHAPENIWTVQALNERWVSGAKPLQDFLTVLDQRLLRMFNVNKRVFLEATKLGTGIYKTGWTYEQRPVWGYGTDGRRERQIRTVSAPFVDHVRLANFLLPAYSYAIQPDDQGGAPWVAERLRVPLGRLYSLATATAPFLPNIDKATLDFIASFEESGKPPADVKLQELDFANKGGSPSATKLDGDDYDRDREHGPAAGGIAQRPREIELWEIHARFPTKAAGGSEDDIVVWYHAPTQRIVRAMYNFYHHGARPYDVIRYFPGDGFFGIGVCEQKEMFQKLGSELFNFTMDNVLLANSRMPVVSSDVNVSPGEPIYPWKTWIVDGDVRQKFGIFPMADIYPSLPMLQQGILGLGEKRTGISDIQMGNMQSLPSRTPATTMLSLLQEGNRRPDLTIRDMRYEGLSQVGLRVLQLVQQFASQPGGTGGERWLQIATDILGTPEGPIVAEKLRTPMEPIELGVGVALTATSGSANKEVERQGSLALLQLAAQVGPQFIQLVQVAMQSQGTPLADVALRAARGLQELYKRTLEQYDVRNIEDVGSLVDAVAPAPGGAGAAPAVPLADFGGGVAGAQGADLDPRMAALLAGLGAGG